MKKPIFFIGFFFLSFLTIAEATFFPKILFGRPLEIKTFDRVKDSALKDFLHHYLKRTHRNGHSSSGYNQTRKILFGQLFLKTQNETPFITDVYCRINFGPETGVAPNKIPNHNLLNTEHTWPKSRFSKDFSQSTQKNDLHHLFPTHHGANNFRGNIHFGDADYRINSPKGCPESQKGYDQSLGKWLFRPPFKHRGNVARAIFYFSIRYKLPIPLHEELILKKWHSLDPVDELELFRNNMISKVQGNRNPFVDFPELSIRIDDF